MNPSLPVSSDRAAPHARLHPSNALFEEGGAPALLPVCDHYSGVEVRMRKSLALQAELGPVFDVTLDCEDGAPVGGEAEHAQMVAEFAASPLNRFGRVGARVHPVDHPAFADDVSALIDHAGERLAYLMVPKPRGFADLDRACAEIDRQSRARGLARSIPVHGLIETQGALREVEAIAAHPRIESLSFGLMDFVASHRGAIPADGMSAEGQFAHPLVLRAKLEISAACHGFAKTPSHCVVTEFNDAAALRAAAGRAAREFGYTRMWSIHPSQILPIVEAFAPSAAEIEQAVEILCAAQDASWAPIRHRHQHQHQDALHDRASYRYFWHVLERAHRTGQPLAEPTLERFFAPHQAK